MVTKRTARGRIEKLENMQPNEPQEIQIIWLHDWREGKAGGYTLGDKIIIEPGKPNRVIPSPEGYSFHYGDCPKDQTPNNPEKTE